MLHGFLLQICFPFSFDHDETGFRQLLSICDVKISVDISYIAVFLTKQWLMKIKYIVRIWLCCITAHRRSGTLTPRPFSRWTWVSQYQNVSILDFTGGEGAGGGGNNQQLEL